MANIILCGQKEDGEVLITVLLMLLPILQWDHLKELEKILQQDPQVATGAGHHSVIQIPGKDEYYIVYHRRPLDCNRINERQVCIDKMEFDENGYIKPVKITFEGVAPVKLTK